MKNRRIRKRLAVKEGEGRRGSVVWKGLNTVVEAAEEGL